MVKKKEKENKELTEEDRIEQIVVDKLDDEYRVGIENNEADDAEFEQLMDMFDNIRADKHYDWQSDLGIPEFQSHIQRHAADAANISFSRTEFVSVDVQKKDEASLAAADAAKELINSTLSRTDLYYFHKYMREIQTKDICGRTYIRCWWEQEIKEEKELVEKLISLPVDEFGNSITNEDQVPARITETFEQTIENIIKDQFNYDLIDPRNIAYSNEIVYNLMDKNWIVLWFDTTLDDLKAMAEAMGYFNLDKLEDVILSGETQTKQSTINADTRGREKREPKHAPVKDLMVVERYGKDWVIVLEKDEDGEPTKITYGYDADGNKKEDAVLLEVIKSSAYTDNDKILIRHQINPYKDSRGRRYKPLARGLCYVHPTRDRGFGDGQASKDLQVGLNDTFNANNDNTLLGLMKIIKYNKFTMEDEMPLSIHPGALWPHEGNKDDVDVVDFPDNTAPALNQMLFLERKLQELNASDPAVPVNVSATATAEARAEKKLTSRSNYKNMVFEKTLQENKYWFILQMSSQFMKPETAVRIMGEDKAVNFNPDLDYIYHPVSEAVETDASRGAKIDRLNTSLGYVINSPNPGAPEAANKILAMIFKLMGDEVQNATEALFEQGVPLQEGQGGGASPGGASPALSAVNQTGLPQPNQEASLIGG